MSQRQVLELPRFCIRCFCSNFTFAIEFTLRDRLTVTCHQAAMTETIGYISSSSVCNYFPLTDLNIHL
jgi:hypothetical protein